MCYLFYLAIVPLRGTKADFLQLSLKYSKIASFYPQETKIKQLFNYQLINF